MREENAICRKGEEGECVREPPVRAQDFGAKCLNAGGRTLCIVFESQEEEKPPLQA